MISILMASGIGTRLWPMSTEAHPKQYLRLLDEDMSMLRQTYMRAKSVGDVIYLIILDKHIDIVREQFPDVPDDRIISTSEPKGTASCVLIALDVMARQGVDPDTQLAFLSADHAIKDTGAFASSLKKAAALSEAMGAVTLIGIPPTYPATGFGYIEKSDASIGGQDFGYRVETFKEKPDYEIAESYLRSGRYVWNSGYFVGSSKIFEEAIVKYSPQLKRELDLLRSIDRYPGAAYAQTYDSFESLALDTSLLELSEDVFVVDAEFDWADVGTYKDLHDTVSKDDAANYCRSAGPAFLKDTYGTYVLNDSKKPIAVIGLKDVIVVNTEDGIFISHKDMSHLAGDIAKEIAREDD